MNTDSTITSTINRTIPKSSNSTAHTAVINFHPLNTDKGSNKTSVLQRIGDAMAKHRKFIIALQWFIVIFYFTLLIWPALIPLPKDYVHFYDNLVLFAQFVFWGIWWPFVMLSMVLMGRVWCGVFCPEGALSEWASRFGLAKAIPHWMRWGGWPFAAFVLTTVYGQLISVYEYPKAALLILGGSTVAAVLVGLLYGRGKRVWCRHLCPANGVFSLLSRLAPVYFKVNKDAWNAAPHRTPAVDCAPLVSVRNMTGSSECHMCGRCSGHRNAVVLSPRSPASEILAIKPASASHWDILLLIFGMLGVATGAFQWSASPWFVELKQNLAEWLIVHDSYSLLDTNSPWWLLTHYPDTNDVFSWLDGLSILLYIGSTSFIIGGSILLALWLAGKTIKTRSGIPWFLGYSLIPLAGGSVFLGLTALTISMLKAEHVSLQWVDPMRIVLMILAYGGTAYLLWKKTVQIDNLNLLQQFSAWSIILLSTAPLGISWFIMFYHW